MPRPTTHDASALTEQAPPLFWRNGYASTSMDALVRATGANRYALYQAFGGKRELYLAVMARYADEVVTPAFARVEADGAGPAEIVDSVEVQIARAASAGLPGPDCLFAIALGEIAGHDEATRTLIRTHLERLRAGFARALRQEARGTPRSIPALATGLMVSANGLWSLSRTIDDDDLLRRAVRAHLGTVGRELAG